MSSHLHSIGSRVASGNWSRPLYIQYSSALNISREALVLQLGTLLFEYGNQVTSNPANLE
jgi:hypothetical protein